MKNKKIFSVILVITILSSLITINAIFSNQAAATKPSPTPKPTPTQPTPTPKPTPTPNPLQDVWNAINTLQTSVSSQQTAINGLQASMSTTQNSVSSLQTAVNNLQKSVTNQQNAINSLQAAVSTTQNSVSSLQTQLNTRLPQTDRIAVAADAFDKTGMYGGVGSSLVFTGNNCPNGAYLIAPLYLPQGAILTRFGFFMNDYSAKSAELLLLKSEIVSGGGSAAGGFGVYSADSVYQGYPIDNYASNLNGIPTMNPVNNFDGGAYYLALQIPAMDSGDLALIFQSAYVEYTYSAYLPI